MCYQIAIQRYMTSARRYFGIHGEVIAFNILDSIRFIPEWCSVSTRELTYNLSSGGYNPDPNAYPVYFGNCYRLFLFFLRLSRRQLYSCTNLLSKRPPLFYIEERVSVR